MPLPRTRAATYAAVLSTALVVAMAGTAIAMEDLAVEDLDCRDFAYQEDAQVVLDTDRTDPHHLDGGSEGVADGLACEALPHRDRDVPAAAEPAEPDAEPEAPATTPPAEPVEPPLGDRECEDFLTQAEAQAALGNGTADPELVDVDDDGIACEW